MSLCQLLAAIMFLYSAFTRQQRWSWQRPQDDVQEHHRRRLATVIPDFIPSYMTDLLQDLQARTKLMEETPPEEVKYWFEYTGPLQVGQVGWEDCTRRSKKQKERKNERSNERTKEHEEDFKA